MENSLPAVEGTWGSPQESTTILGTRVTHRLNTACPQVPHKISTGSGERGTDAVHDANKGAPTEQGTASFELARRLRASCAHASASRMSWTFAANAGSLSMRSVIFWTAYMTVEWSRPEKYCPISGYEWGVSSRMRYMAI